MTPSDESNNQNKVIQTTESGVDDKKINKRRIGFVNW